MELNELQESKRSKTEEFEAIVALGKEEKRELTADELQKVEGLQEEVRGLDEQITAKETEEADAKRAADEALETELKDVIKSEIEEGLRAMSKIDANAEVEKAYAELDRAWAKYWEACEAEEKERRLEELRGLVKEILAEPNMRNEQGLKDEALEAKRQADEKAEELEKTLQVEREAKEALENELKENKRSLEQEQENERKMADEKAKTIYDVVREASSEGLRSETIEVKRAAADGDTTAMAKGIPLAVKEIDRVGKKPIWQMMGLDIMNGAKGTYMLPHETPRIGEKLAELASVTKDAVSPDGVLVQPGRYSKSKEFTYETMESATDAFIQSIISDLRVSIDRAKTADVYAKALAGATEVATVTGLDRDNFIDLMAAVEVDEDGSFLSARSTYFKSMKVAVDAGSGKFLSTSVDANGQSKTFVTETGAPYWYSSLFDNGTDQEYVVYGDLSKIHFANYDTEKIIVDPYTKAAEGKVIITVISMAGIVLKNPDAFAKSTDLDPA